MTTVRWLPLALAAAGVLASPCFGRIKLITLPVRERVEIQLDHPDATLVEEERIVPLVKGENQVDFSWANTAIDPSTIVFRVVGAAADVKVLSVSYPPNEAALVWAVGAGDSADSAATQADIARQLKDLAAEKSLSSSVQESVEHAARDAQDAASQLAQNDRNAARAPAASAASHLAQGVATQESEGRKNAVVGINAALRLINEAVLPEVVATLAPGGVAIFSGMEEAEAPLFRPPLAAAGLAVVDEILDAGWWGVAARRA